MAENILTVNNISSGYGKKKIIKNISFEIQNGQIISLIGPNGCGKSTLLRTLSGAISPMEGNIFYKGKELFSLSNIERAREMAFLFTDISVREQLSCFDMVSLGRYPFTGLLGLNSKDDEAIIRDSMEKTDTWELKNKKFPDLSDGQKQRVLLAKAIAQKPKVLILDEPTTFLDVRYKLEFLSLLKELADSENFAILMSLHELDLSRQISDKIICMKNGCIDKFSVPEDVFTEGYINSLFDIKCGRFDENSSRAYIN